MGQNSYVPSQMPTPRRSRHTAPPDGPALGGAPLRVNPHTPTVPRTTPAPAQASPAQRQAQAAMQRQAPMQRQQAQPMRAPAQQPAPRTYVPQPAPPRALSPDQQAMAMRAVGAAFSPRSQAPVPRLAPQAQRDIYADALSQGVSGVNLPPTVDPRMYAMSWVPGAPTPEQNDYAGADPVPGNVYNATQFVLQDLPGITGNAFTSDLSIDPAAIDALLALPSDSVGVASGVSPENYRMSNPTRLGDVAPTLDRIDPGMPGSWDNTTQPASEDDMQAALLQTLYNQIVGMTDKDPGIFSAEELAAQKAEIDKQTASAKNLQAAQLGAMGLDVSALGAGMMGDLDAKGIGLKTDLETNNRVAGIEAELNKLAQFGALYGNQMSLEQQKELADRQYELQKMLAEAQLESNKVADAADMATNLLAWLGAGKYRPEDLVAALQGFYDDPIGYVAKYVQEQDQEAKEKAANRGSSSAKGMTSGIDDVPDGWGTGGPEAVAAYEQAYAAYEAEAPEYNNRPPGYTGEWPTTAEGRQEIWSKYLYGLAMDAGLGGWL